MRTGTLDWGLRVIKFDAIIHPKKNKLTHKEYGLENFIKITLKLT